jgi:hypothetical protein
MMLSDFDTNPATLRKLDFKKGRRQSALFQFPTGFYPRLRTSTITANLWKSINLWKISVLESGHPLVIGARKDGAQAVPNETRAIIAFAQVGYRS